MILTITEEAILGGYQDGSVMVLTGKDEHGGTITFGADVRMIDSLMAACMFDNGEDGEIEIELEAWQILGRSAADPRG